MFSKRHYVFLADWLASATICTTNPMARGLVASGLADRLERDNPRFDRARFLKAAGRVEEAAERGRRQHVEQPVGWDYFKKAS
jgi:hypothetical protein